MEILDFSQLLTTEALIGVLSLTLLELVLGIDNIVFISILASKLPKENQRKARNIGLFFAMIIRICLLFAITWIMGLSKTLFTVFEQDISGKDIILIIGGLFLIYKSTTEIHHKISGKDEEGSVGKNKKVNTVFSVVFQIILIDIVFSVDSILTAVGLTKIILVMVIAVIISMIMMMLFSGKISSYIEERSSIKMIALSFLMMIGLMLVIEGLNPELHIPKGYIYFGLAYAFLVEQLNLRAEKRRK